MKRSKADMNKLSKNEALFREIFKNRNQAFSQHLVSKAEQLNSHLYTWTASDFTENPISQFRDIFIQMAQTINFSNRREYCKVLLHYCNLSNDWQDWGIWAEQEIEQGGSSDESWLLYGLGRYLEESGQLQKALAYHQRGITVCIALGDKFYQGLNHIGIGIILQHSEQPKESEWHLKQAITIFHQQSNVYQEASALIDLASCYYRFGKQELAISHYKKALVLLDSIDCHFDRGRVLYSLGVVCVQYNQLEQADLFLNESHKICGETRNLYYLASAEYGKGWLEYVRGNLSEAKRQIKLALENFEKALRMRSALARSAPYMQSCMYLLAGAVYNKGPEAPDFETALAYLDLAEQELERLALAENSQAKVLSLDHPASLRVKVLANRARVYKYSGNKSAAIETFLNLLREGKRLQSIQTCGDAAIHLIWIYWKQQASLHAWGNLATRLGAYGLLGLVVGVIGRVQRFLSLSKFL